MKIRTAFDLQSHKKEYGTWGIQTRKRKGLHYSSDYYGGTAVGVGMDRYTDRLLSDSDLWTIYRRCADVRACIDSIVRRVATFDWMVVPKVSPQNEEYKDLNEIAKSVQKFLNRPNRNGDTWQEIMTAMLTDCLCFDSGVFELAYDRKGNLQELVPLRGATIQPVVDEYGRIRYYEQNIFEEGNYFSVPTREGGEDLPKFKAKQIMYLSLYKNTALPSGNPIIECVVNEVIALLRSTEHAMLALDADEIPPGILVLSGIAGRAAEEAKADLQRLKGQDHKIRVMTTPDPQGVGANWLELRRTPRDLSMREIVGDIRRTIYRVFGVMPVEMGMTQDVPKATATVQLDVASSHLVTPILELVQSKINSQIIPAILKSQDVADLIEFKFDRESRLSPQEQNNLSTTYRNYVTQGIMTRNEIRETLGLAPVEGGDVPTVEVAGMPQPLAHIIQGYEDVNVETDDVKVEIDETLQDMEDFKQDPPFGDEEIRDPVILASSEKEKRLAVKSNAKEAMDALDKTTQETLKKKGKEHNEKYGDNPKKKLPNINYLAVSYWRGIGAYKGNPESVRPVVTSAEQWAYGRVNGLLYALKNGEFKRKPFDTDLLPKEHKYYNSEKRDLGVGDIALPETINDIIVKVVDGKFELNGKSVSEATLSKGFTYLFRQDDESNRDNTIGFYIGESSYKDNVKSYGFAGEEGAYTELITDEDTPAKITMRSKGNDSIKVELIFIDQMVDNEELPFEPVKRHVIFGYKELELAPKDQAWGYDEKQADKILDTVGFDEYKKGFLFVNKGGTKDPKQYKLPVAKIVDGKLKLIFRGVITAGSAIRGDQTKAGFGSGYYNISQATLKDRKELYEIIKKLYSKFGEKAPTAEWELEDRSKYGIYIEESEIPHNHRAVANAESELFKDIVYPEMEVPTDTETLNELKYLIFLKLSERDINRRFIENSDHDIVRVFLNLLDYKEVEYDEDFEEELEYLANELTLPIMELKYKYNRPRPIQVAKAEGIIFDQIDSESSKTPSFPSGHAIQSHVLADYIARKYPQMREKLEDLASRISFSRLQGGYHFYSDIIFGKQIASAIIEQTNEKYVRSYYAQKAVGDKDPTNFPKMGDNTEVHLHKSKYPLFPLDYAAELKKEYPEIWKLGGNIRGNHQYEILTKIEKENNGEPKTVNQEAAIRRREAWMARHLEDFRIAGVIAQVKWLGIGSRGLKYMKDLIEEHKKKIDKKKGKL